MTEQPCGECHWYEPSKVYEDYGVCLCEELELTADYYVTKADEVRHGCVGFTPIDGDEEQRRKKMCIACWWYIPSEEREGYGVCRVREELEFPEEDCVMSADEAPHDCIGFLQVYRDEEQSNA